MTPSPWSLAKARTLPTSSTLFGRTRTAGDLPATVTCGFSSTATSPTMPARSLVRLSVLGDMRFLPLDQALGKDFAGVRQVLGIPGIFDPLLRQQILLVVDPVSFTHLTLPTILR